MKRLWIAGAFILAMAFAAGDKLVIAYQGGAVTLDPHMRNETTTLSWQHHLFETPFFYSREGKVEPVLAESIENTDPNTWILKIRKGVKFHDGTPMTAEDVAFSITRAATHPKSQMKGYVGKVESATALDEYTVEIKTKVPDPLLPAHLDHAAVIPKAYFEKVGEEGFAKHPIGTGPYKFVEWLNADHLTLTRFEDYWGSKPDFKDVVLKNIPQGATRVAGLLSGEIDIAEKVLPQDFARVERSGRATVEQTPGIRVIYVAMDYWREYGSEGLPAGAKNPFLDPAARKAIYMAINEEAIVKKIMGGAATVAPQFLTKIHEGYSPNIQRFPYDPKAARKMLEDLGYGDKDGDGWLELPTKDGKRVPFSLRIDSPNDRYLNDAQIAQAIASMLRDIGIKAEVNAVPKKVFFPNMTKGHFTLYMAGWGSMDSINTMLSMFHSKDESGLYGRFNREHYHNPKVDALIEQAAQTFDPGQRNDLLVQAMDIAMPVDVAYIPLHYENVIAGVAKGLEFTPRPDEYLHAYEVKKK
ncbi:ABC transporter substrate-binding protein [Oceanithermus sp.]